MLYWQDAMRSPAIWQILARCALLALLSGCQPAGPDVTLGTLLANLLVPSPTVVATPESLQKWQPPAASGLQLATPPASLAQLDFLALSGCAVQTNIIRRDTSLARHAKPSQRLLLELEFLRLAPPCIAQLRGSNRNALADSLQEVEKSLREQLPALIFNATLGSEEYQAFWNITRVPGEYPRVGHAATLATLTAINENVRRWLGGDFRAQNREFELLLSGVAGGDGGALRWTLLHQAAASTATDSAEALRYRELLALIMHLEAQLAGALPPRYRSWMSARGDVPGFKMGYTGPSTGPMPSRSRRINL
jgi:hypothetical protein